jgi:hypothetical protein
MRDLDHEVRRRSRNWTKLDRFGNTTTVRWDFVYRQLAFRRCIIEVASKTDRGSLAVCNG